jgi:formylglycine-generating enzyme required for sulfatase activity
MLGNVWQWCEDMTYGRNVLPSLPPEAPNSGWYASLRGGCATSDPREVSVASGLLVTPDTRDLNCRDCMHNVLEWRPPSVSPSPVVYFGFRCARG